MDFSALSGLKPRFLGVVTYGLKAVPFRDEYPLLKQRAPSLLHGVFRSLSHPKDRKVCVELALKLTHCPLEVGLREV